MKNAYNVSQVLCIVNYLGWGPVLETFSLIRICSEKTFRRHRMGPQRWWAEGALFLKYVNASGTQMYSPFPLASAARMCLYVCALGSAGFCVF